MFFCSSYEQGAKLDGSLVEICFFVVPSANYLTRLSCHISYEVFPVSHKYDD
jgi:hypothetical protein